MKLFFVVLAAVIFNNVCFTQFLEINQSIVPEAKEKQNDNAKSKTNDYEISYDFKEQRFISRVDYIPERSCVRFVLKNFNPFRYNAQINKQFYTIQAKVPEMINKNLFEVPIDVPKEANKILEKVGTLSISRTDTIEVKQFEEKLNDSKNKIKEFQDLAITFLNDSRKFKDFHNIEGDFIKLVQPDYIDAEQINKHLHGIVKIYFDNNESKIEDISIVEFRSKSTTLFEEVEKSYEMLDKKYNEIVKTIDESLKQIEKDSKGKKKKNNSLKLEENVRGTVKVGENNNQEIKALFESLKKGVTDDFNKLTDAFKKIKEIGKDGASTQAGKAWELFYSISTEKYERSTTIQATSEYDIIKFKPQLIKKNDNSQTNTIELPSWEIAVDKGFRIDFSTGLIINKLVDRSFSVLDTTYRKNIINDKKPDSLATVTEKYLIENERENFSYSIAALTHFYYRIKWLGFGVNLGVGLKARDVTNIQYLGGLSVLVGKEQRIVLNGGAVIGKVNVLDGAYKLNKPYVIANNTIPTRSMTKVSWYFGISYNLTGKNVKTE